MEKKQLNSLVYLYEVDDWLGGDALTLYDLASLAGNDIKWLSLKRQEDNDGINVA